MALVLAKPQDFRAALKSFLTPLTDSQSGDTLTGGEYEKGERVMARASRAKSYQGEKSHDKKGYAQKISDHIAVALVAYTLLLIFVVTPAIEGKGAAIWPYFLLVILVAAVIPPFHKIDKRWQLLEKSELSSSGLETRFTIDRIKLWVMAIGAPFALALICRTLAATF